MLGEISSMVNAVCRTYLTDEHQRCNTLVQEWMGSAGMQSWQDEVGNVWGRWPSMIEKAPTLVLGSHLDTIPNAGKYDGILGVLLAISVVQDLHESGQQLPFNIDIVGFGDEEGSRFGTTLMGSRAVAGTWEERWLQSSDKEGITLRSALEEFGCHVDRTEQCSRAEDDLLAYIEVHIEQGPVLEQSGQPLGVVSSIAGARRFVITISGKAGHAGTVPMEMRQDALVAAASAVHMVEKVANRFNIVATVGELQCYPGAPNVIPGDCRMTIDIRSGLDHTRDLAIDILQSEIQALVEKRAMTVTWTETHNAPAVLCASHLQRMMEDVLLDMKLIPMSMVSGAGHDAMSLATITDIAMLFVRCAGGVSHHPDESITKEDVCYAADALKRMLLALSSVHTTD